MARSPQAPDDFPRLPRTRRHPAPRAVGGVEVVALGLGDDRGEAHGQRAVRGMVAHLVMLRHPKHPFSEQRASLQHVC